ncbi:MAG: 3-phosphoserine/phosphohydroxythreonine transaminase [Firmicutes bacterium]|nr:3-phosphoserine/phosphohydroxythreonine transaminase [Bacillota bacterium]
MRVYNFSAGPSILPEEVLRQVQSEMLDYGGTGMSVTEMSHRGKTFVEINDEAEAGLRELMNIGDDYYVLFLQGGASMQFEAIPLNMLGKNNKADYLVTGNFAQKAYKEGQKYGDLKAAASSKDANFTYIPKTTRESFRPDAAYVHIAQNNTIFGTRFTAATMPDVGDIPLVSDMSSNILSEVMDVNKYAVIYAGAQKNIAPAGVTVVIAKKSIVDDPANCLPYCPTMLKWKTQADEKSLYNTPPCFSIYVANLVFKYLKAFGGVTAMQKQNEYKAGLLYDFLDQSKLFKTAVNKVDRSIMNIPFVTGDEELDNKFVKEASKNALVTLKGHKLVGGMRASIYNAMPVDGVKALVEFMKKFECENK